ncbi:Rrf2 family transcriptional regulator [Pseudarthrobacter phenanthrenivorans]|uniref:Transcriptional regulator, BadM/Rrf2 family n=1 Tax=Pseudarthrobacter phenanthrenivorans (strain DSM 18606 / JCM 16027 / LMG 23796 / Sphe3) TaxID=930171 RepID=F0M146_PSEPM|nr:Rrf2 family transcriptional regulator [Pseudarthrobacter phenanthrenivorans]ADX71929.1 transcriptional regulator, BadM/Rrf2 family [Pseudarthrobacter phenanthrenivorans Sphe3]TPV50094.1 Rrf2 family transcriptional regulator [Pseudarthrobacter phenanthrenivorans]
MKINAFADVSLRALMVLAAAPEGALLTTQNIADSVGTPYNHVSKAMAKLRSLGLIDVVRGRTGGSSLSHAGRYATVGQVLRQLDTRTDAADCVAPGGNCPLINECKLRSALARAREAFYRELDSVVIADLPGSSQMAPVFTMIGLRPGL